MRFDVSLFDMKKKPARGLFITGTNTGVGKTYVACLIAKALRAAGHRVGVYKPAVSGAEEDAGRPRWEDVEALWEAAGQPGDRAAVCPQCFLAPLAPHLAARAEGKEIDADLLRTGIESWADQCDVVIVEGAGGLMSPVSDEDYVADLAFEFGYPLVVVAANELGVINQTLQTLVTAATFRDGIDIAGVVLNDVSNPQAANDVSTTSNYDELVKRCGPPLLAHLDWQSANLDSDVDWFDLAGGR